jgi:hypothetical protein
MAKSPKTGSQPKGKKPAAKTVTEGLNFFQFFDSFFQFFAGGGLPAPEQSTFFLPAQGQCFSYGAGTTVTLPILAYSGELGGNESLHVRIYRIDGENQIFVQEVPLTSLTPPTPSYLYYALHTLTGLTATTNYIAVLVKRQGGVLSGDPLGTRSFVAKQTCP